MKRWLDQEVLRYTGSDAYPFHIPGAKRKNVGMGKTEQADAIQGEADSKDRLRSEMESREDCDPFRYDITEIGGFDDLRHASGLLAELEQEWAEMYGAKRAFLSVNGSTCGNLSMIFAATKQHGKILAAEGCHWSVRNAAEFRELTVERLPVERSAEGFCEAVTPDTVERALSEHPEVQAAVITSPTYEGLAADVPRIAEMVHSHGAALLVDAAHGAHLGLRSWDGQPDAAAGGMADRIYSLQNPITQGADAVVVSLHKTLPVLGQVSLILLPKTKNPRVSADEVKRYLNMFQTSSPSYLLMSSAAAGCRFLQEQGAERYRVYARLLADFYEKAQVLNKLHIIKKDNQDLSKIIISTKDAEISGQELLERLRTDYHLELEKAGEHYALAITGIMDTKDGFDRLAEALYQIDRNAED
ncbi:MAG: aminotransferase class V-fold PLP-dependent enzyme [Lachnospiraceae bacterium]|nr:aminotransferase class V-fold PLP-dependent enzyme [Lachnospiraceae bacterium]